MHSINKYVEISIIDSVVNGQSPVMGHDLTQHRLSQLPQKMVHFHCETYHTQLLVYVLLYHLHCHNRRRSDFHLLLAPAAQLFSLLDLLLQLLRILHDLVLVQNLRHSVVCEHRQLVNVFELSQSFSLVHAPNSCYQNLRPLVKVDLMSSVNFMVLEVREVPRQNVHQINCTFVSFVNNLYK